MVPLSLFLSLFTLLPLFLSLSSISVCLFLHLSLHRSLCPSDILPPYPLHPPGAPEEGALLHRVADDPADCPVCLWDVPSTLHEDGLPSAHDPAHPHQVGPPRHQGAEEAHTDTQTGWALLGCSAWCW